MSRSQTESLLSSTQSFFQNYLRQTRGASAHTVRAYRDALKLFFLFLADHERKPVAGLTLDDVRVNTVLAFLQHIETKRGNSAITRNCRLAAVRSFVQYLLRHDVTRAGQYSAILAIRTKRATRRAVTYLEPEEARALIAAIDARSRHGQRDRALLLFLYNTGARVGEALSLRPSALRLDRPRQVRLPGVSNSTNAAGEVFALAVLRRPVCDSVVRRLSLPYSKLRTLAVRNTPCSLAISAAAAHNGSGIGSRPVWGFRHCAKRP